jgi:hypothetical protein
VIKRNEKTRSKEARRSHLTPEAVEMVDCVERAYKRARDRLAAGAAGRAAVDGAGRRRMTIGRVGRPGL